MKKKKIFARLIFLYLVGARLGYLNEIGNFCSKNGKAVVYTACQIECTTIRGKVKPIITFFLNTMRCLWRRLCCCVTLT